MSRRELKPTGWSSNQLLTPGSAPRRSEHKKHASLKTMRSVPQQKAWDLRTKELRHVISLRGVATARYRRKIPNWTMRFPQRPNIAVARNGQNRHQKRPTNLRHPLICHAGRSKRPDDYWSIPIGRDAWQRALPDMPPIRHRHVPLCLKMESPPAFAGGLRILSFSPEAQLNRRR